MSFGSSGKKSSVIEPVATAVREVTPPPTEGSNDAKLRRSGRASLISTSPQGILGNATTGRRQLLSAN